MKSNEQLISDLSKIEHEFSNALSKLLDDSVYLGNRKLVVRVTSLMLTEHKLRFNNYSQAEKFYKNVCKILNRELHIKAHLSVVYTTCEAVIILSLKEYSIVDVILKKIVSYFK